jgi:hypothetical protein
MSVKPPVAIRAQYPRTGAALAALLAALALAGCGDDDDAGGEAPATTSATAAPQPLTPADSKVLADARRAVGVYCVKVARSVSTGGGPPPAEDFERVTASLETLGELAREKPDAELALGDILENLEGSNCDNRLVTILNAELAEIPDQ